MSHIKELIVTDSGEYNRNESRVIIKLQGGAPWYGIIYFDHEPYQITFKNVIKIKKCKPIKK